MTTKKLLSQDTFRVMDENEIIVSDRKAAENIFNTLGLKLRESISRYRESYELFNCLIEIDINDTNFCPFPYIEIETNSKQDLEKVVTLLGYTLEDTTSKTMYELIDDYKRGLL